MREIAAIPMGECNFRIDDLAFASLTSQLDTRFEYAEQTEHARVDERETPASSVDRKLTTRGYRAVLHESATFTFRAKAEILKKQDRQYGEGIVQLNDIHVLGRDAGHLIGARTAVDRRCDGQILHLRYVAMPVSRAGTEDKDRRLTQVSCAL